MSEQRVNVRDHVVRELQLNFHAVDLIPASHQPAAQAFDMIVITIMYHDMYSDRPRKKTVRIPANGF